MLEVNAPEASVLTVEEYLEQWLGHVKGRVRATTYEGYAVLARRHAIPHLGPIALDKLHPLQVQQLYAQLSDGRGLRRPLSAQTVGNLHRVLHQALSQAVRWQLLSSNPAQAAQPPRVRRGELAVIDPALGERILAASRGKRLELPVAIAMSTGMRRGEILGLKWGDLDPGYTVAQVRRSLQITKGGLVFEPPKTARSRRSVALPRFLGPFLERAREDQGIRRARGPEKWQDLDLVIDRGDGGPWNPDTFSRDWPRFLRRAGLPSVRFHDLRHAHATFMLAKGIHPKVVSERLGHSSVGITLDTYSHVLPSMQSEAARAFDELFESEPQVDQAPTL